jgi:uncharacterized membrane protein
VTRLERTVGAVLRVGVVVSSGCFALGLVLTFTGSGAAANLLLQLGVVVLLSTPVARVLVSVADYAQQRDWTFTFLTLIVLVEMTAGAVTALLFNRRL